MKFISVFVLTVFFSSSILAQGLKFEENKAERFTFYKDPIVGLTTVDSFQKITWMRCLVDQEFNVDEKVCAGSGKAITFQQAVLFASKIGNGWRLPTYWEVEGARDHVMKIMAGGKRATRGKYGGGGWDCDGKAVWTRTGVQDQPNLVNLALCTEFSSGADIKNNETERQGDRQAFLILVRK